MIHNLINSTPSSFEFFNKQLFLNKLISDINNNNNVNDNNHLSENIKYKFHFKNIELICKTLHYINNFKHKYDIKNFFYEDINTIYDSPILDNFIQNNKYFSNGKHRHI